MTRRLHKIYLLHNQSPLLFSLQQVGTRLVKGVVIEVKHGLILRHTYFQETEYLNWFQLVILVPLVANSVLPFKGALP